MAFPTSPLGPYGTYGTYGTLSHKIDYVTIFWEILNLEGHLNRITGSRVTAILMNGWILPIGGA